MRRLGSTRRSHTTPLLLIVLAVVVATLASAGPSAIQQVAIQGTVYCVLAVGLYIFVGNSGVLSFGHMAFALVGGYVGSLLVLPDVVKEQGLKSPPGFIVHASAAPVVAVLVAGLVAALIAVVVAVPLMRVAGLTAGLASFALLLVVHSVAANLSSVTAGTQGLFSIPIATTQTNALLWLSGAILVAWAYQRSRLGLLLRTTREEETAAQGIGVTIAVQRSIAFVISAFFMGVGGALFAMSLGSMSPDLIYLQLTLVILSMVVIGGMTSLSGAVVGAILISVLREVLDRAEQGNVLGVVTVPARPGLSDTVLAVVLIVLLAVRPAGIMGGREVSLPRLRRARSEAPAHAQEEIPA